jgi:hypothetical protein
MAEQPKQFSAIVAVYGVCDKEGNILTEQAAVDLFDTLCWQAESRVQMPYMRGYRIIDCTIGGDRLSGWVEATFEWTTWEN